MNFNFISSNLSLADKNILGQIRQFHVNNALKLKFIESKLAVCHHSSYGPVFGERHDLYFHSFDYFNNHMSFESYQSPSGLTKKEGAKYGAPPLFLLTLILLPTTNERCSAI